jgi:hypothetical protein
VKISPLFSPTGPRPKRQKTDKNGKLSAFERLKLLKGKKNKYVEEEIQNVFDYVDDDRQDGFYSDGKKMGLL